MKTDRFDGVLGFAVLLVLALLVYEAGVAWGLGLFARRALALFLWEKSSRTANVLAVVLVPAVLLAYLLPRNLRRAIKNLAKNEHEPA